jgi:hypothetical protein
VIREHFLDPKVVMRLLAQLQKQLESERHAPKAEIAQLQRAATEIETEIANLVAFIAGGDVSESVRAAIHRKEGELKVIRVKLEALVSRGKASNLEVSEAWLVEKLSALRELMNFKAERIPEIRAELQTILAAPISLTPQGCGKKRSYEALIKGKPLQILAEMPCVSLKRSATGIRTLTDTWVEMRIEVGRNPESLAFSPALSLVA